MTIRELELEIVDEFSIYENWMEKIDLSESMYR